MKSILKITTIAAAAIALTAGTAFAWDLHPVRYTNAHGQHMTLYRYSSEPTTTIGFFGQGRGIGERKMMWRGHELTEPVMMRDAHGREFVVFRTVR